MVDFFPTRFLSGLMQALGLSSPNSDSSSDMEMGSDSEPETELEFETEGEAVYVLLDEIGNKRGEKMGLYRSTDENDELLRILPYRISLSQDQLAKTVKRKLQRSTSNQELIVDVTARLFAPFSLHRQEEEAWLNGRLINKFMDDLAQRYVNKKIVAIDANLANLDTYISGVSMHGSLERQKLKEANVIFWPICCSKHWYLLIVEKQGSHFSIQCLDGNNLNAVQEKCLVYGQMLAQRLYDYRKELTFSLKNVKIPVHNKSDDDGAVICCMAEKYCQNYTPKASTNSDCLAIYEEYSHLYCDYTQFRLYIARLFFSMDDDVFYRGWQPSYQQQRVVSRAQKAKTTQTKSSVIQIPDDDDRDLTGEEQVSTKTGKRVTGNVPKKLR